MQTTELLPKTQVQITEALRKMASINKNVQNICYVFAMRERTRFEVNVVPLRITMAKAGYDLSIDDIEKTLVFFASLGIGKLQYDDKKRLKGLSDIRWTLQSVGKAAIGEAQTVNRSQRQRRYSNLPSTAAGLFSIEPPAATIAVPMKTTQTPVPATQTKHVVHLSAIVSGKEVKFALPVRLTSTELVELIAEFNNTPTEKAGH